MVKAISTKTIRSADDYFKDRLEFKMNRYAAKARRYKWIHWVVAGTAIVGAAVLPGLVNIALVPPLVTTGVSVTVAVLVTLEGLFHPREHWRNYDLVNALLSEEEMRFSMGARPERVA